jgi:Divergent InlB B-repeat domain/PASTA domain
MRWTGAVAVGVLVAMLLLSGAATASAATGSWQALANLPPFNPGAMYLLTDGTVMVQDLGPSSAGSSQWWRLTPDSSGSYVDGTWSQLASLPSYYTPGAYAAAVLPDGRLAIEGGEWIDGVLTWTNLGAIYDPLANAWTMVSPPAGGAGDWSKIGDAPSVVLADGRWLVGDSGSWTTADAIFDPATLTWTATTGPGKTIGNAEAGFTLLPSGKILTVDALPPACTTQSAEILDPATLDWSSAGVTPMPLVTCDAQEIGPQVLMYNGKVFVEGGTDATALYDTTTGNWSAGPNFPVVGGQQAIAPDAGAALLPDGNVFLATRAGSVWPQTPSHFFLFDGTSLTQAPEYPTSTDGGNLYMLLLPTGQVLYNGYPAGLEIFSDGGSPNPAWAPQISIYPNRLAAGDTYQLVGLGLNGLSEGAAFGDDYQSSTDYPLVQITNDGTGDVAYARTSGMTNRSIAPGASSCTDFTVPSGIETGTAELRVIANGIASDPVPVTVGAGGSNQHACPVYTLSVGKAGNGSGTVTSAEPGIDCGATCSQSSGDGTIVTLSAAGGAGSAFAGWSGGGCAGTGACIVTLDADTSVTATFTLVPETLAVWKTGDGTGTVASSPAGIDCGTGCSQAYDYGSSVTLTASAAKGSAFAGWAGDCSGAATCVIAMTAAHLVEASFVKDCVVPKLKGKRLKAAKRTLLARDCRVGKVRHAFSKKVKKGRVIAEKPKPHRELTHGARVSLVVSKGKNKRKKP